MRCLGGRVESERPDHRVLQDQDVGEVGDSEVWKGSVWHSHGKETESGV